MWSRSEHLCLVAVASGVVDSVRTQPFDEQFFKKYCRHRKSFSTKSVITHTVWGIILCIYAPSKSPDTGVPCGHVMGCACFLGSVPEALHCLLRLSAWVREIVIVVV